MRAEWKKEKRLCQNCFNEFYPQKKNQKNCSVPCAKKSVGKSRIGVKRPESVGLKVSIARKGIKFSEEHIKKLRDAKLGKKRNPLLPKRIMSSESKYKMSIAKRGIKSPFWDGGKSSLIRLIRRSVNYREWRSNVFKRDNFTCVFCKEHDKYLNADHIFPFSGLIRKFKITSVEEADLCKELWDINNGRTLCIDCHKKTDTYLNKGKVYLKKINL